MAGSLVTQIFGMLSCLVLRVYRAMISSCVLPAREGGGM